MASLFHKFHKFITFSFCQCSLCFLLLYPDSSKHRYIHDEIAKYGKGNITSKIFNFRELSIATNNFTPENLLGEGGFGRVHKGYIDSLKQVISFYFFPPLKQVKRT